jgi:hypothetical protein
MAFVGKGGEKGFVPVNGHEKPAGCGTGRACEFQVERAWFSAIQLAVYDARARPSKDTSAFIEV